MAAKSRSTSDTLKVLETTEANLAKAERLWTELRRRIPDGIDFSSNLEYDDFRRRYRDVVAEMPAIDGFRVADETLDLNAIAQWRLDAMEVGEVEAQVSAAEAIDEPGRALATYRYRLDRKRRTLIRDAVTALIADIDEAIATLPPQAEDGERPEQGQSRNLRSCVLWWARSTHC